MCKRQVKYCSSKKEKKTSPSCFMTRLPKTGTLFICVEDLARWHSSNHLKLRHTFFMLARKSTYHDFILCTAHPVYRS